MAQTKHIVDLNISGNQITNLGTPTSNDHAARKDYVDDKIQVIESTLTFNFGSENNISNTTQTNVLYTNTILGATITPIDDSTDASLDDWINNGVFANITNVSGSNITITANAINNASGIYKANLKVIIKT